MMTGVRMRIIYIREKKKKKKKKINQSEMKKMAIIKHAQNLYMHIQTYTHNCDLVYGTSNYILL